jgi:uncharacterized SAM-binding protein YcdF (DUF218 family)
MFLLKKIVEAFIMPPGILILIFISLGIVQSLRKKWRIGFFLCLLGLTAWAISIAPFTDRLMEHLESGISIPDHPAGDVIIVLGAGINRLVPDVSGTGAPSETTAYRLYAASMLYRKLKLPILFSGAGNSYDAQPVMSIVFRALKNMGVPENKIMVEEQSRDTKESALKVAKICTEKGFKSPILVSSAYHIKRSVYCFNKEGLHVIPFPARFETWEGKTYTLLSYLPGSYNRFSRAMKEIIGLKVYQMTYWFQRTS